MHRRVAITIGMVSTLFVGLLCVGYWELPIAAAQVKTTTLKVQASWPSGLTIYDNLRMFAERVEKMSAGRLKIDHLPGGTVVGPFEVLGRHAPGRHRRCAYRRRLLGGEAQGCWPPGQLPGRSLWHGLCRLVWLDLTKGAVLICIRSSTSKS